MRRHDQAAVAVAVIAALVFLPSVSATFVFDDVPLVSKNEYVQAWQHAGRAFRTHFWDISLFEDSGIAEARRYYRPLVTLSYLANWMLGEGKAWAFHLVNVLLHAVAAALAVRAASRWTRSLRLGIACGLVFALHPSRTESVTWISGRTDVMMLVFAFLALEAFRAFRHRTRWTMFGLGLLALAAAVLSKEPGAMLVFLALADRELARTGPRSSFVPAVASALGFVYVAGRALFWAPEGPLSRTPTPAHFLVTLGAYVQRAIVPWPPTMLSHALESRPDGTPIYSLPLMALGVATLAATAFAGFVAWRRARTAFWLLLAAYAFMGPLLNVYFTSTYVSASDRFLYAPLFFAVCAVVVIARSSLLRIARRRAAAFAFAGVLLAATFLIEIRTLDYRSTDAFWQAELAQRPDHPYALDYLGLEAAARGDLARAYEYFGRLEQPSVLRYPHTGAEQLRLKAHFLRALMLASLLPDGRGEELAMLLDELWRLEQPGFVPKAGTVRDFEIGQPLALREDQRLTLEKTLQWDVAFVASRVGDFQRTRHVADHGSRGLLHVASNPLNGALALARLGRLAEARAIAVTVADRQKRGRSMVSEDELASFTGQLARAEAVHDDALRLASLGAFLAALRALEGAGQLDARDAAPLVAQLLVACRLEDGARAHVERHLGAERASSIVAELVQQLPENLRAISPVEKRTKEELLEGAAARRVNQSAERK